VLIISGIASRFRAVGVSMKEERVWGQVWMSKNMQKAQQLKRFERGRPFSHHGTARKGQVR
jgi:hypothetical protein